MQTPSHDYQLRDSHFHFYKVETIPVYVQIMKAAGLKSIALAAYVEGPTPHMNPVALLFKILHPDKVYVFGSLDYTVPGALEGKGDFEGQARRLIAMGADGIKMLEGKPDFRKLTGLPLCAPVYDAYYGYLQAEELPLLFHVADPEEFWDPVKAPEWARKNGWYWADGSYVSKEQLYQETEEVLRKFPQLHVTFAHFFFLSADLDRAARFLDRWPLVCFDITAGIEMYYNFAAAPKAWREFFVRYQDRIIFGTDTMAEPGSSPDSAAASIKSYESFLKTDAEAFGGRGLKLPPAVVAKICAGNFERRVGKRPRKANRALVQEYSREMMLRIKDAPGFDEARAQVQAVLKTLSNLGQP